ncbi:caspase domain-containing protein [Parachaetomium inaequale]|uniref:Caspase domain-containing protein n=1 Tax=Parachaetomium inaequale TaxID=2588326 RepID=A0AAN6P713_9PEZI|nr:caspase domain-containing protein [Parachaetomium inaequale]
MEAHTEEPLPAPGVIERWALLIGVDYYFPGTERNVNIQPLKGCVRDVLAVEDYLKSIGVPDSKIFKLTASQADANRIKEKPKDLWPTRNNIIDRLDYILQTAAKGALVYIHYSGHGILRGHIKGHVEEGGNKLTGTALVPIDVRTGGAYLSGYQLGVKIKQMVESRSLRVTLVLDSCHSGQGLRHDDVLSGAHAGDEDGDPATATRFIDELDDSELDSDKQADSEAAAEDGNRAADTEPRSWLDDPRSCTVVTACGVFETAKETVFGSVGRERRGVLTYWILDMLRRYPAARLPSYSQVRDYVRSKTAAWVPRQNQTPGIFGDAAYEFFGSKLLPWTPSCGITKKGNRYILAAGKAQGVAPGAVYELLPGDRETSSKGADDTSERRPLQVRVEEVFDLQSTAAAVSEDDVLHIDKLIDSGHRAMLHRWALPRKTYVEVAIDNPQRVDHPFLDMFTASLKKELKASTWNLLLKTPEITKQEDFRIVIEDQTIEIHDRDGQPLVGLPKISLQNCNAIGQLVDVLRHAARFQAIKELRYGRPTASHLLSRDRFSFGAYDLEEEPVSKNAAGQYMATHGQRLNLVFEPTEKSGPLYVSVFNLAADSWAVNKMYPPQKVAPFQLQHPEKIEIITRMNVPLVAENELQQSSCTDTIRAYVYMGSSLPSWDELQLQTISVEVQPHVPIDDDSERYADPDNSLSEDGHWTLVDLSIITSRE